MFCLTRDYTFYLTAIVLSIFISFLIVSQQSVVNADAICYLQSASIVPSGLHNVMHLCDQSKWPFYSIFIFAVAQVTHFSFEQAAYLLDGVFSLISVLVFVAIIRFIKNKQRLLWLALLVILCAHNINAVKQYIIRDHGFWAFYLISILCLLHFFKQQQVRFALAFSLSLVCAALFRIEAVIYLIFIPFFIFFNTTIALRKRWLAFFQLNAILIVGSMGVMIWLSLNPDQTFNQLGRLGEVQQQFAHGLSNIITNFDTRVIALKEHVLTTEALRDASFILGLVLLIWYIVSIISNLSLVYAFLVIYAWYKKSFTADRNTRIVLWGYIIISVLITGAFFAEYLYLAKRYLIALSLVFMLWVPFALDSILFKTNTSRLVKSIVLLAIIIFAYTGLIDRGYSKRYISDAGAWLALNTPKNALIYSNDYLVMYYSKHFGNHIFEQQRKFSGMSPENYFKNYDFIALHSNKKNADDQPEFIKKIPYTPIKVFKNKRGDQVRIYQVVRRQY